MIKICPCCNGKGYIKYESPSLTFENEVDCTIACCNNCKYCSVEIYLSDPPKIRCCKDNSFHYMDYLCPKHKTKENPS